MQSLDPVRQRCNYLLSRGLGALSALALASVFCPASHAAGAGTATNSPSTGGSAPTNATPESLTAPTDPVLSLLLEKGMITEDEAEKTQAQADALRTNMAAQFAQENSKWRISKNVKDLEIFGDLRLRYEDRSEDTPETTTTTTTKSGKKVTKSNGKIDDDRERYALRFGLRGDTMDDFYYGFRLETSSNPRSTWVTMGSSSPDPYGKSALGLDIGQIYFGWSKYSWLDLTAGKMPNPLYTSSMVWSPSINPEGLAEHLKYNVGNLQVFANFAQFIYQDENPNEATPDLGVNGLLGQSTENIFQVAWQGEFVYNVTTNISAKAGGTIYEYFNLKQSTAKEGGQAPYYGDNYVGEGAYSGPATVNSLNGASGYGTSGVLPGYMSVNYPNNQVGLDHLLVLEVPFEVNVKIKKLNVKAFADFAYNLDGRQRAIDAADGYKAYLANLTAAGVPVTVKPFSPQVDDVKAYQFGLAIGNKDSLGLVNGSTAKRNAWELRGYWQHVEQYSLDPNLLDLDYMAGAENLQGFFVAFAYGFSDNFVGSVRYGHANRINEKLGTGGTGTDIPNINPIESFDLFQADLTYKF
jgi:hypothetical protein